MGNCSIRVVLVCVESVEDIRRVFMGTFCCLILVCLSIGLERRASYAGK